MPQTRAKLARVHTELFQLDHRLDVIVPLWLVVEAIVSAALEDPDGVVATVRKRLLAASEGA